MTTKATNRHELPIPSGAAEDPDAMEILRVWVRRNEGGDHAVAANFRIESANLRPGDVGVVIGSACVSIVEGVAESVGAKTNAQRAKVTFDFLLAVAAEFGIRLELDDFVRGSRRARN